MNDLITSITEVLMCRKWIKRWYCLDYADCLLQVCKQCQTSVFRLPLKPLKH